MTHTILFRLIREALLCQFVSAIIGVDQSNPSFRLDLVSAGLPRLDFVEAQKCSAACIAVSSDQVDKVLALELDSLDPYLACLGIVVLVAFEDCFQSDAVAVEVDVEIVGCEVIVVVHHNLGNAEVIVVPELEATSDFEGIHRGYLFGQDFQPLMTVPEICPFDPHASFLEEDLSMVFVPKDFEHEKIESKAEPLSYAVEWAVP